MSLTPEQITELNTAAGGAGGEQIDLVTQGKIAVAQAERRVAREKLDGLVASPEWGKKLTENDPATVAEWQKLTEAIASDDPMPTPEGLAEATRSRQFNSAVDAFAASNDLPPAVIADIKAGGKVAPHERKLAEQWFERHLRDNDWCARIKAGEAEASRELALCSVILSADVDPKKQTRTAAQ